MIFLETFLVNLIKSQRIFAIICYYLKYLVSKFRILVHKRTILAWKLIFCSTLSTFRPKCPKTNGYNQTKNKLSLIIYFGNPKFWKCLGYNYDWLSIPPPDENLLFCTFVHCGEVQRRTIKHFKQNRPFLVFERDQSTAVACSIFLMFFQTSQVIFAICHFVMIFLKDIIWQLL